MKKSIPAILIILSCFSTFCHSNTPGGKNLEIVLIRHGEKLDGDNNLSCQGFNRSVMLPAILYSKFGPPAKIYIPAIESKAKTTQLRMLQTITPLAVKYHVAINSRYNEEDYPNVANALLNEKGLIVVAWDHKSIPFIVHQLVQNAALFKWPEDDFNTICVITFKHGKATLTFDSEKIKPGESCSF
jgi:hypothetical protein